ncbi:hypothetical protein EVG20_g8895 [Dentipellis fragilis]|uniref:Peptidase A1 domain-containing protein n=1 Tax=Dentipellis fragilis TaxID=205917 RepID=A0A4Y9Y3L5_9AGAM|nr:hypothetical protein EVG20_g8895 [Dentipellis fragilis]
MDGGWPQDGTILPPYLKYISFGGYQTRHRRLAFHTSIRLILGYEALWCITKDRSRLATWQISQIRSASMWYMCPTFLPRCAVTTRSGHTGSTGGCCTCTSCGPAPTTATCLPLAFSRAVCGVPRAAREEYLMPQDGRLLDWEELCAPPRQRCRCEPAEAKRSQYCTSSLCAGERRHLNRLPVDLRGVLRGSSAFKKLFNTDRSFASSRLLRWRRNMYITEDLEQRNVPSRLLPHAMMLDIRSMDVHRGRGVMCAVHGKENRSFVVSESKMRPRWHVARDSDWPVLHIPHEPARNGTAMSLRQMVMEYACEYCEPADSHIQLLCEFVHGLERNDSLVACEIGGFATDGAGVPQAPRQPDNVAMPILNPISTPRQHPIFFRLFTTPFNALLASVLLTLSVGDVLAVPTSYKSGLARRAAPTFSTPITTIPNDAAFHVQMAIGKNPKPFLLHLDSATPDLWVYSQTCPQRGTHNGVTAAAPNTFKAVSTVVLDVAYQDGDKAEGEGGLDTLLFAGQKVATPALEFGVADEVTGNFPKLAEDGVLGLGPPGFDDPPFNPADKDEHLNPPFMQNLLAARVIPAKVTGWKLPRTKDVGSVGSLAFGAPDPTHFVGALVPVKAAPTSARNKKPWGVPVTAVTIDGAAVIAKPIAGFVDFGTTDISMSPAEADALNVKITGAKKISSGVWQIPCNTQAKLALTIGGKAWPVDPRDLAFAPVAGAAGLCESNIVGQEKVAGQWILGGTFLKNVYTVLDEGNTQVAFAQPNSVAPAPNYYCPFAAERTAFYREHWSTHHLFTAVYGMDSDSDDAPSPSVLHVPHSLEEMSPFIEESPLSIPAPLSIRRRLYISHLLSTWNSRVFEFGAMLFFAGIFPNTLLPMSAYALTRSLSAIASARGVGRYIDGGDRLAVVRTSIVGQRAAVVLSCIAFWILSNTTSRASSTAILGTAILAALACVEKPCSVLNLICVERDWVVVISGSDTETLQALNAQMRRIDLFCKLVGPLLIAAICDFSLNVGIYTVFGLGAISVAIEYYAIAEVYGMVPELKRRSTTGDDELQPVPSCDASMSSSCAPTEACSLFSGLSAYLHHPAFLPSFTLSLLYLTVLSFGGQMVTYLLSAGYTPLSVGLIRACSTCFEISATWIAPRVMARIGPVRGGIWFLNWQIASLAIAMQLFWTIKDPYIAASSLVVGVVLSRVGLWGFDLCAQVIIQEEVGDENRGSFSTTEASFQNAFELLSYLSTMVFYRPEQFRYPVLISCVAVSCAGILYSVFVRRRRGHLVHFSSCIKLRHQMQRFHDGW